MASDKPVVKAVAEWELVSGMMLNSDDKKLLEKTVDRDAFNKLVESNGFIGVNFGDRAKWLEANHYELTRANMRDASLAPMPPQPGSK